MESMSLEIGGVWGLDTLVMGAKTPSLGGCYCRVKLR